jgi:hypothetical protein
MIVMRVRSAQGVSTIAALRRTFDLALEDSPRRSAGETHGTLG